jgi:hypothetical protein
MIPQLIARIMLNGVSREDAGALVLQADPLDLLLHMEQVWMDFNPYRPNPRPGGPARDALLGVPGVPQTPGIPSLFSRFRPGEGAPAWHHLGYSYVLENSRAVQILRRVVREFRAGEGLGIPSVATQRWLDATEALLFGAANPIAAWLGTSSVRPDAEAIRRNAYHRLFGLDLAFGSEDNRPPSYDKAVAANSGFVALFEELLFELWQAMTNTRNTSGVNQSDDDRIFRLAEELQFVLRSRRQNQLLAREELAAATGLGWVELTLSANTPVVIDLRAEATSPASRLRLIGERVGLPPHSKTAQFFSMAADLSLFLRTIEAGVVTGPEVAWALYLETPPASTPPPPPPMPVPIGAETRRVITEWAAATGKDLKARGRPIETRPQRQLVRAR